MDKNYTKLTKIEVASIVATYQVINGERHYLSNILADAAREFNLTLEEKNNVALIVTEEVTNVKEWSNKKLMDYYNQAIQLNDVAYLDFQITDTRFVYIMQDCLCIVLHNEIERRMK